MQVLQARQRLGDATFDWVATLPMVLIYIVGSWTMAGWIARRLSPGGGLAAVGGAGLVSGDYHDHRHDGWQLIGVGSLDAPYGQHAGQLSSTPTYLDE
jgi:hypothetical protein